MPPEIVASNDNPKSVDENGDPSSASVVVDTDGDCPAIVRDDSIDHLRKVINDWIDTLVDRKGFSNAIVSISTIHEDGTQGVSYFAYAREPLGAIGAADLLREYVRNTYFEEVE